MTKQDLKDLAKALAKANKTKDKIAGLRDTLRGQIDDLTDLLDSFDMAIDDFESGSRLIRSAADSISLYI